MLCLCLLGPLSEITRDVSLLEQCRILAEHCRTAIKTKSIPLHETQLKLQKNAQPIPPSEHEDKEASQKIKNLKFSTNTKTIPIVLAGASEASQKDLLTVMKTCVKSVLIFGYRQRYKNAMHNIALALCREFERAVQVSRWCVACFLMSALRLVEQQMIIKQIRYANKLQGCAVALRTASNLFLKLVRKGATKKERELAKWIESNCTN